MKTIKLQGKEYAQVKDRLAQFRKDAPNGSIETAVEKLEGGEAVLKATVIFDLSDEHSKRSTGHAFGQLKGEKAFEKLETIAVGRALAMLGYQVDGDIASAEEMEEFLQYQENKVSVAKDLLESSTTLEDLKKHFASLGNLMANPEVIASKDAMKLKLGEAK